MLRSGGRVSLDGVAARGLVNGRGPSLAMGGMESELVPTEPSQTHPTATVIYIRKKATKSLFSHPLL